VLANFGLSTQLAALGVCLAAGAPAAYAWSRSAAPSRSYRSHSGVSSCSAVT
jgi:hypothetical protein